ncbi:endo alpha-1,4 polygalactosaminidase [Roseibium sp. CAU 1637]|uniref:Endo alpha-1,4 polygalactosaminidase n=1 Tax=Roseibium limicola TaxID=2816037 RepID=A0A939EMD6_9HYPH|nr:MJ1477/TM1410 family putative glycoside hydrolase [Roseibium limicola]MBO0343968.1 endo alpha-1,4 polygalactosaminidase [Roseibium limicola]
MTTAPSLWSSNRRSHRLFTVLACVFLLSTATKAAEPTSARKALQDISTWGYQLQGASLNGIAASPYQLVVIDHSRDGSSAGAYSRESIAGLKKMPDGRRRLVVSYFSIGEAEDYRGYWQPEWFNTPPQWLEEENPNWPGNYVVKFWDPQWQDVMIAQLDRIIAAGFDGVYLDRVDIFQEFTSDPDIEQKMIEFVQRLSDHAREKNPDFIVIGQNAEGLLRYANYISVIDGVGKEDLLFGVHGDEIRNSDEEIYWSSKYLRMGADAGVPIFIIEYLNDPDLKAQAAKEISKLGYVVTCADRALELPSTDCR